MNDGPNLDLMSSEQNLSHMESALRWRGGLGRRLATSAVVELAQIDQTDGTR
jgi:hypothetical protein